MSKEYNSSSITILEGLEAVRKRPGMYIGATDNKGLHHLIWEIVDNSIDEVLEGYASEITVLKETVDDRHQITVIDNGRGIPVDKHPKTKKSTLETILTTLHAGGKFDSDNYEFSGGLHGVGSSVVNALAWNMKAAVLQKSEIYFVEFSKGVTITKFSKLKKTSAEYKQYKELFGKNKSGTLISFIPDREIFNATVFSHDIIKKRLQELAYLNKGLLIKFDDTDTEESYEFQKENGLFDFVQDINSEVKSEYKPSAKDLNVDGQKIAKKDFVFEINEPLMYELESKDNGPSFKCNVALMYNKSYEIEIKSFVNNIYTSLGGTHKDGVSKGLFNAINKYGVDEKYFKDKELKPADAEEGLVMVISLYHQDPIFEGQTKQKLSSTELKPYIESEIEKQFIDYLYKNKEQAKLILEKVASAINTRKSMLKSRDSIRNKIDKENKSTVNAKLAACSSKKSEERELFIVEGDSAGGSAKSGRDNRTQAILPLRGKVLNVLKASDEDILKNVEIATMISAIGGNVKGKFVPEKTEYGKIIIMTDADVDGSHIAILLLTFFNKLCPGLIEAGRVFMAKPPLYKITEGKKITYCYSDDEKDSYLETAKPNSVIQRYKGLGEMNPEQLRDTTMDKSQRKLIMITKDDASKAEEVLSDLMGKEAVKRRDFIIDNAKF